jgi:hypothetical protein
MEGMKVKIKGVTSAYVKPLYGKVLEIIFNHKTLINRAQIAKVYDLYNKGLCPKLLEIGQFDKVVGEGIEEVEFDKKTHVDKVPVKNVKEDCFLTWKQQYENHNEMGQ